MSRDKVLVPKVLVPIAIRGLRKKVHEEFQQYLDLVDWIGIVVEDKTRECKAAGEWFVTEEGRMPEALVQKITAEEEEVPGCVTRVAAREEAPIHTYIHTYMHA